jgi:hypothetical protein
MTWIRPIRVLSGGHFERFVLCVRQDRIDVVPPIELAKRDEVGDPIRLSPHDGSSGLRNENVYGGQILVALCPMRDVIYSVGGVICVGIDAD